MISVLVFTLNEQQDLPDCLKSLSWSDDVHVFDSMSTDNTVNIARQWGANVVQRPFDNEAAHKNWALRNIPFKYEWVYCADADERVTPELAAAMKRAVFNAPDFAAFRVQRRDYLMGRWLKHVVPSPFNTRLFQSSKVRFERLINPVTVVDGATGEISEHFDHFPFSKGMAHWVNKHNRYSTLEAHQIIVNRQNAQPFSLWKCLFEQDRGRRRFHQKELFYRCPFRPLIMFVLLYVFKRGFLDRHAGLVYAMLRAIYEYMIVLKEHELSSVMRGNEGGHEILPTRSE